MVMDLNLPNSKQVKFIHPAEEVFARILDFYGIEWQYEPQTFQLQWNEDGKVNEAFTPDFYLPEQNLFVELTTLRPKLSTNKNRKLRLLNELYPEINIKLFKRRELHQLMVKFGLEDEANKIQDSAAQG